LGLGYALLTPVFENSDETLHYPYVKHLAAGRGLPLARPGQLWNQEGTQPPLYYALVAATTFWIDSDNLPELLQRNPHWLFTEFRTLINDNQNRVLHGPLDAFPYQRAALAVYIGRGWSLLFGIVAVICTFCLARQLFPRQFPLVLTATALIALNPQFLRVSATVSNDSLATALATLTILLAFYFTSPQRFQWRRKAPSPAAGEGWGGGLALHFLAPLVLGLLTGLAVLTKLSALGTLLVVGWIIVMNLLVLSELHEKPLQHTLSWLTIMGLTTLVITGWWFWRNYLLYGEWFATDIHLSLAGRHDIPLSQVWALRAEAERAFWATFGWGQIRPPEWVYQLLFWFSRVGGVGLLLGLAGQLIQGDRPGPLPFNLSLINFSRIFVLLVWAGLNLMLYVRWVMEVGSVSHTRLVFPALAAIALLLAIGWHTLLPARLGIWFSGLVTAALITLNLYSLGWLIYPAFSPNQQLNPATTTTALDLTFLGQLKLAEGAVYSTKASATTGDVVLVQAHWQTVTAPAKNYSVAAVLIAPDGAVLARRETYPGLGLRPTRYLQPGADFWDVYPLRLTQTITAPLVAQATVNLFDFDAPTRAGFPALNPAGQEITPIIGQIKIVPNPWPTYQPGQTVRVNFADRLALIGYDLTQNSTAQPSELTLYWQSLAPVEQDYVLFVHLLDKAGRMLTQADGPPTANAYPTRWWAPPEIIADRRVLPPTPGVASLWLGLYELNSGQRLPIVDSTLPHHDNGVELALP
jgi:hypothetical protein